ncbi:hypothetical protein SAMN04490247_2441 [Salimicrobium halophilum]|uniref:DUF1146 domain-containing protein n=1 Tax=Salimicrobium halophilum TaxID=86666 RepID=A0A1G8UWD1_9BACI|nr:hypothetical protein SAMN04490247_2441 [Salimicrobium halophilum]
MFIVTILIGLCILFFPLQGIRDFKTEKVSFKIIRLSFIALSLFFLTVGVIDLMNFINHPDTYMR